LISVKQELPMRRTIFLCTVLLLAACKGATSAAPAEAVKPKEPTPQERAKARWTAVIDAADRTEDDRKLDNGRKPAEMLEFLDLKPGMKVAELGAGAGYTTELIARAVGPSGVVYAQNPQAFLNSFLKERWPARLEHPAMKGVVPVARDFDDPLPPEAKNLDEVVMNAIYHDTVWTKVDRARMNQAVFAALQPGGRFCVVDSSAKAGTGDSAAKDLHRIDEELVKAEVEKAGFKLESSSDFLRNAQDPRDWNASPGAAGEKRGTSDRFALRFVKPQGAPGASKGDSPVPPALRLPGSARPERAQVELTLTPTAETFAGRIELQIAIKEPLQLLWLNADSLTLVKIQAVSGNATQAGRVVAQDSNFVGLGFEQPLNGSVKLTIDYTGKLSRTDNDGAFKQEEGGEWYVLTHLEPTGARRIFPCFDEPAFKIPWQLTLHVPRAESAFANTLPESDTTEGAVRSIRFAETKPLPSYLVAFAVGPFEIVSGGKTKGGVPVRIVVTKGKKSWAAYSASSSAPLLEAEASYFGRPYEYGKLDLIEVPLSGGAMENPGLNTFAQRINLRKPMEGEGRDPAFEHVAASVEAHEFAHQWFGDLVTTAWWDDIWLNEAFATWDASKTLDKVHPAWGAKVSAQVSAKSAMETDALIAARRIRQPISSLGDVRNAFDGITYQKGAAVIGMFEAFVGADKFQKGVQRYLKEHANGNATASEFLAAISAEAGKDVTPAFSTFLDQAGVPLVTATLSCNGGQGKISLSQERYLPLGSAGEAKGQLWQIPVCAKFGKGAKTGRACTLLTTATGEIALRSCPDWVLPNDAGTGYYRSGFGEGMLSALTKNLARLSPAEKVGLASDALALARAGKVDYAQVLALVPQLAADKSRFVVAAAMQLVGFLREDEFVGADARPKLAAFIRDSFGKRALTLGLAPKKGEDDEARLLRAPLLVLVGNQGEDPAVRAQALQAAQAWLQDRKAVQTDLVPAVLQLAALSNEPGLFDQLALAAKESKDRIERQRLLAALGDFDEPALVQKALAITLDPAFDGRESIAPFYRELSRPKSRQLAADFLDKNFDALVARLPRNSGASFSSIAAASCDESRKSSLEALLHDRVSKSEGGPRIYAQAMERLQICSAFRKEQSGSVAQFLAQK